MLLCRNYKYRIYPSLTQETTLLRWEGVLRFLWNLCHEQRLLGYARSKEERVYVSQAEQSKQMAELLSEYPWIAEVQNNARGKVLEDLADAWKRCFKGIARRPRWKRKGDEMRIYVPVATVPFEIKVIGKTASLQFLRMRRFGSLGAIKLVLHRSIPGIVKSWSLKREGKEWYAIASCEIAKPNAEPINDKIVGIDRGVALPFADSDGRTVPRPDFYGRMQPLIARAQRQFARKKKGSKNAAKAAARVAKRQRKVARMREVFTNTESLYYAESYGTVVLEDLKLVNMTASAKGTEEKPGKNVKAKSTLNRSLLDNGLGMFAQQVEYKTEERAGKVIRVDPRYTSQKCPHCHHIDPDNRSCQATFRCVHCGYEANADINAGVNIKERGVAVLQSGALVPKKPKVKMPRLRRKPKIKIDTTVKPTVVLPVEDTGSNQSRETGTIACEGYACKQVLNVERLN